MLSNPRVGRSGRPVVAACRHGFERTGLSIEPIRICTKLIDTEQCAKPLSRRCLDALQRPLRDEAAERGIVDGPTQRITDQSGRRHAGLVDEIPEPTTDGRTGPLT
jgi:hypothetical protein